MLSLESARETIRSRLTPLPSEIVALPESHGRFLAESVVAPIDLPPFDNSAMDGYAVRSADVTGATPQHPVALRLIGRTTAGDPEGRSIEAGACLRIFTGAPLPAGADAVVMQEDTRSDSTEPGRVWITDAVKPWENVRFRGEDVKSSSAVLAKGDRLTSARIGLAAALGIGAVKVRTRPRIALLATGSELVEAGQSLGDGKIYESNRALLTPLLERAGAVARVYPIVPDTLVETNRALSSAVADCDAVITSGGVSVGELDFVKKAFEDLGGRQEFWRVAIKPGKPFVFGQLENKFLFGLPGNPVSALVTFLLLVLPALRHWQGAAVTDPSHRWVTAGELIENRGDRRHFVRARLDESGTAWLAGTQASHLLGSLAAADGLIDVPAATTISPGASVAFIGFED